MNRNSEEKKYYEDIICAKATPYGSSAIAVIRVSGKNSWKILDKIFKCKKRIDRYESHRVYYGKIVFENEVIDTVLVTTFAENKSFTGEESFEISCHGSELIVSLILKALISLGARIASPGEFSKRAFLNGKIDLIEAESIVDIINASTKQAAFLALNQLTGKLSKEINQIKDAIANLLAEIEVFIDYPEEDLTIDIKKWDIQTKELLSLIEKLLKNFNQGRLYREGIGAVIAGRTNSGKSTLFNFLLNEDKAIVSDIHGTTRDYLDALINIEGFAIRIYDTAGLRETNDPIEKEGTKRTKELIKKNMIVIYVLSAQEGLTDEDILNLKIIDKDKKLIIVINKIDINNRIEDIIKKINELDFLPPNYKIVKMSALKRIGLEEFNEAFLKLSIGETQIDSSDILVTNERHALLLEEAKESIKNSNYRLKEGLLDLAAFDLRDSLNKLGEITGEITSDDIINKIFSTFCVGK